MNLSYRGISYQPASPAVDVTETEHNGVFLGNRFKLHQCTAAQRSAGTTMKYRGASYNA